MLTIGSDVISFSTASGAFTSANPGTIALLTALPTIDEDLAIIGLGSSVCIIQGMELHPCSGPVL